VTLLDGLYLVFGTYYVLDGLFGVAQTRNWLFLSELLACWVLAASTPFVAAPVILRAVLLAIGTLSLIPLAFSLYAIIRGGERYQIVKEFAAIRRQRRSLIQRYIFRYKPYAQLTPPPASPAKS
jgi:hypothetical protein